MTRDRPRAPSINHDTKGDSMQHRKMLPVILGVLVICALTAGAEGSQPSGVVNINTASAEELQLLPRVGPALAGRIIEFREANGPFRTVDEILAVKGIGESSFEKLEPYIVTSGATTLTEKVRLARSTGGAKAAD
jgi:competence ComEA-like helix-hairpin-helix protein